MTVPIDSSPAGASETLKAVAVLLSTATAMAALILTVAHFIK